MARQLFSYIVEGTFTDRSPMTICQIVAATNIRAVLKSIETLPQGATGASAALKFDLVTQDDEGTSSAADAAELVREIPEFTEVIQTAIRDTFTAEPTNSTPVRQKFGLHQQATRTWEPGNAFRELQIPGGARLGLRVYGQPNFNIAIQLNMEE